MLLTAGKYSRTFFEHETAGYSLKEMLFACYFMHADCTDSDFVEVISHSYGRCFTFADKPDKICSIPWSTLNTLNMKE